MCRPQPVQPQISTRRIGESSSSSSASKPPLLASWSKPRQIPMCNHLWINTARYNASLPLLQRSRTLDTVARLRAEEMASEAGGWEVANTLTTATSRKGRRTFKSTTCSRILMGRLVKDAKLVFLLRMARAMSVLSSVMSVQQDMS